MKTGISLLLPSPARPLIRSKALLDALLPVTDKLSAVPTTWRLIEGGADARDSTPSSPPSLVTCTSASDASSSPISPATPPPLDDTSADGSFNPQAPRREDDRSPELKREEEDMDVSMDVHDNRNLSYGLPDPSLLPHDATTVPDSLAAAVTVVLPARCVCAVPPTPARIDDTSLPMDDTLVLCHALLAILDAQQRLESAEEQYILQHLGTASGHLPELVPGIAEAASGQMPGLCPLPEPPSSSPSSQPSPL
ncbi:hypothetical protein BD309DRAFT_1023868 [Dichomitus squalens]|nr:hypothetical protein BD309DRAFT_1023868 [Dichomitus squalens]